MVKVHAANLKHVPCTQSINGSDLLPFKKPGAVRRHRGIDRFPDVDTAVAVFQGMSGELWIAHLASHAEVSNATWSLSRSPRQMISATGCTETFCQARTLDLGDNEMNSGEQSERQNPDARSESAYHRLIVFPLTKGLLGYLSLHWIHVQRFLGHKSTQGTKALQIYWGYVNIQTLLNSIHILSVTKSHQAIPLRQPLVFRTATVVVLISRKLLPTLGSMGAKLVDFPIRKNGHGPAMANDGGRLQQKSWSTSSSRPKKAASTGCGRPMQAACWA